MTNINDITNNQEQKNNKTNDKMIKTIELIFEIMAKTGWDHKQTITQVEDAKARIGISYKDYNKYSFHNIPTELQEEEYAMILEKKRKEKEKTRQNVEAVMSKTGWDYDFAVSKMKEAKIRVGINFTDYNKYDFYEVPIDKQKSAYKKILSSKEKKKKNNVANAAAKNEKYLRKVMDITGWDKEYAETEMSRARKDSGASFEQYYIYKFWTVDEQSQNTFFTKRDAKLLRRKYNTDDNILNTFMNKDLCNQHLTDFLGRPWMSTRGMSYEDFKTKFENESKIIYKPRSSSGGNGIQVFELNADVMKKVYFTLLTLPKGIIEGYVIQHPEMRKLSVNSVNTIRVVTIRTKLDIANVEKNKVHFLYAGMRMGQGNSYVDNLHSGGMIAIIDLETGEIITPGVDHEGITHEKHPDTGINIVGFKIPFFKEIKETIINAYGDYEGYFGWDIAITENGPIIIEVNTSPGADGLQTPYVPQKKGMKYVVEKFL